MAIRMTKEELERQAAVGKARFMLTPLKRVAPTEEPSTKPAMPAAIVDHSLEETLRQVAAAISAGNEATGAQVTAALAINDQIASALKSMCEYAPGVVHWNVRITKRDALGRIAEVQFIPDKQ